MGNSLVDTTLVNTNRGGWFHYLSEYLPGSQCDGEGSGDISGHRGHAGHGPGHQPRALDHWRLLLLVHLTQVSNRGVVGNYPHSSGSRFYEERKRRQVQGMTTVLHLPVKQMIVTCGGWELEAGMVCWLEHS